jgi:hypothetical protein
MTPCAQTRTGHAIWWIQNLEKLRGSKRSLIGFGVDKTNREGAGRYREVP